MTKQQYIDAYWQGAVEACHDTGIFALLALAESAVESAWGESKLTKEALNFFGIKSTDSWEANGGQFVTKQTREVVNGQAVFINAKFRKYDTPKACFENFVHFVSGERYVKAGVLTAETPEDQIKAIAAAGYATDPNYASTIISVMHGLKPLLNM